MQKIIEDQRFSRYYDFILLRAVIYSSMPNMADKIQLILMITISISHRIYGVFFHVIVF